MEETQSRSEEEGGLTEGDLRRVGGTLRGFHRQFALLFGRKETQRRSAQYLRGLVVQRKERRNAENLAEVVQGASPRALQRFLTAAPWATEPVVAALQAFLSERLLPIDLVAGEVVTDGVFTVDDTGFAKRGTRSAGVARQYSGTLGKVDICQVGVFLGYATGRDHTLIDGDLFLPEAWTNDPDRCRAAGVPEDVIAQGHRTKVTLALEQLRRARARGTLPGRWVTADAGYGQSPTFRDTLDAAGWWYVVEVPCTTLVFPEPTQTMAVTLPPAPTPRLVEVTSGSQTALALATALPPAAWTTLAVAEGAQGPRSYQFAARRVWESTAEAPGRKTWVLWRRNLDGSELKHYLSNAPPETPLVTLGHVGALRWTIETGFQFGKGEAGLDEYEVRSWAGWHHHVTLVLLALAFLLTLRQDWGETNATRHAATGRLRARRAPPTTPLDPCRLAGSGVPYPALQCPRHSRTRQTPPAHAT